MTQKTKLTASYLGEISYTDFVGLVNQWNVLPGSYSTLSKWAIHSRMDKKSKLLEIACTTGFSSRELSILTGCSGEGFDLSKKSVEMAKYNKKVYAPNTKMTYSVVDGNKYKPKNKFSHIVVGAALGFFPDPDKMLGKCVSMLVDGGYVLASPFYVTKEIPSKLLRKAEKVFGITPTQVPYKEIMKQYSKLEILFEERNVLTQETKEELHHYCKSTIDRAQSILGFNSRVVYDAMYERLYAVKDMSNELRPYQEYSILVLRYRKNIYPNRFVELF